MVEAEVSAMNTEFAKFPDYEFDDPARTIYASVPTGHFRWHDQRRRGGQFLRQHLRPKRHGSGKLNVEPAGEGLQKAATPTFTIQKCRTAPTLPTLVLWFPKTAKAKNRVDIGKDGTVKMVALGENGAPLHHKNLSVGLYRVEWRWWWGHQGDDYVSQFNSANHFNAISTEGVVVLPRARPPTT